MENPLVHVPKALPAVEKANDVRRQLMGKLRSIDMLHWDGIPYGSDPRQCLHVYERNDLCPRDGWPTVLLIHGGGWVSGSKDHFTSLGPLFTKRGMMAVAMDYRLAPVSRWPSQLEDVLLALDWLAEQQVDPKRIILWGHSAGGHLALLAGLHRPEQVRAVVALGAPTRLDWLAETERNQVFEPEQLSAASPLEIDCSQPPPTLLVHGAADRVCEIRHARTYAQHRNNCQLIEVAGGDHGLRWPPLAAYRARRQAIRWLCEQMDMPKVGSKWKRRKKKKKSTSKD